MTLLLTLQNLNCFLALVLFYLNDFLIYFRQNIICNSFDFFPYSILATATFVIVLFYFHLWSADKMYTYELILKYSDIRGVAIAGVEGEPVNLTEPVAEAIAAAFAAWLVEKKKSDGSQRLKISIGHDSRISAHTLQVFFLEVSVGLMIFKNGIEFFSWHKCFLSAML